MFTPIKSLVPNPDDLLALEAEELAGVLLAHLNSYDSNIHTGVVQLGEVNQYNFLNDLNNHPEYPNRQDEVNKALMEAWNWLQSEGFLISSANINPHSFFLSRRAQRLKSRGDFAEYRKASLLPKGQLHPLIAGKVYPAFLRGEYDTAVFQAFREVEVAVREAGNFPADLVGTKLMREAFRPVDPDKPAIVAGPLTDSALPAAEQKGMADLFSGAIGLYKNPKVIEMYQPKPARRPRSLYLRAIYSVSSTDFQNKKGRAEAEPFRSVQIRVNPSRRRLVPDAIHERAQFARA